MPDNSKHDVIARQWEMLKLLPQYGTGKSAGQLTSELAASGFEVDKRTVERDLIKLSTQFPIISDERSKPYGWRWSDDARIDLPSIELSEALSLKLMEQFLKPMLPSSMIRTLEGRFRLASDKLATLGDGNRASRWINKVKVVSPTLNLMPPTIPLGVLESVQEALLADEQIDLSYRSTNDEHHKPLRIHPLGLIQRGQVTYVVATVFDYVDPRLLALHRIKSAERTGLAAHRAKGFALEQYIASGALEFGDGEEMKLVAKVSASLARHLSETSMSSDMRLVTDGEHFKLTATMRHSWQLHWWVLSQGDDIEITKPAAFRREIGERLLAAAAKYAK